MWKYKNHALTSTNAPHEDPNVEEILNSREWKQLKVFFLRYTTDYNDPCYNYWYYCIKDNVFDISTLKSKRRYEINKGNKNFIVKEINPIQYKHELYKVYLSSFDGYDIKPKIVLSESEYSQLINSWSCNTIIIAAFDCNEDLVGFASLIEYRSYVSFNGLKVDPKFEKLGCNAAIVCAICEKYNEKIETEHYYICDGEKNVLHHTNFQEYLQKYFGFRKIPCKLNIKYKWYVRGVVCALMPFKSIFAKYTNISIINKIHGILLMENILRMQEDSDKKR